MYTGYILLHCLDSLFQADCIIAIVALVSDVAHEPLVIFLRTRKSANAATTHNSKKK